MSAQLFDLAARLPQAHRPAIRLPSTRCQTLRQDRLSVLARRGSGSVPALPVQPAAVTRLPPVASVASALLTPSIAAGALASNCPAKTICRSWWCRLCDRPCQFAELTDSRCQSTRRNEFTIWKLTPQISAICRVRELADLGVGYCGLRRPCGFVGIRSLQAGVLIGPQRISQRIAEVARTNLAGHFAQAGFLVRVVAMEAVGQPVRCPIRPGRQSAAGPRAAGFGPTPRRYRRCVRRCASPKFAGGSSTRISSRRRTWMFGLMIEPPLRWGEP